jgi:hypothetical protein
MSKWIFEKYGVKTETGLNWLSIGPNGGQRSKFLEARNSFLAG